MTATDKTADAFTPPDSEATEVGRSRFTAGLDVPESPEPRTFASVVTVRGLQVAYDRSGATVTPLGAHGIEDASRPIHPRSTSRVLGRIDEQLVDAAWRDNARLRKERDEARTDYGVERGERLAAHALLSQVRIERDAALKRVAELELTVKALGEVIAHAAGHERAASSEEGGE